MKRILLKRSEAWKRAMLPADALLAAHVERPADPVIIAKRDSSVVRPISGDPVTLRQTRLDPENVATAMSALLVGLPYHERRTAAAIALDKAQGKQSRVTPWFAAIPSDFGAVEASKMMNGFGDLLMGVGMSDDRSTIADVKARAEAIANRQPLASDPDSTSLTDSSIAHVLLQAFVLDPRLASEHGFSPEVINYLKEVVKLTDADRLAARVEEAAYVEDGDKVSIFDCASHVGPLGAAPMQGSLKSTLKGLWNKVEQAVTGADNQISFETALNKVIEARDKMAQTIYNKEATSLSQSELEKVYQAVKASLGSVATQGALSAAFPTLNVSDDSSDATTDVTGDLTDARSALEKALEELKLKQGQAKELQKTAEEKGKQAAKLAWAQAILESPDDVADMLVRVSPNMADPSTFLSSVLSLLPAAKQSGKVGTLSALASAIKAAVSKGSVDDSAIYNLLASDPAPEPESESIASEVSNAGEAFPANS